MTLPGTDHAYAKDVYAKLKAARIRCEIDERNEKIGYKVREARQVDRVPYMVIIGHKEIEEGLISVRDRDTDQTETMTLDAFMEKLQKQISERE